jgi:hypothetical protein
METSLRSKEVRSPKYKEIEDKFKELEEKMKQ